MSGMKGRSGGWNRKSPEAHAIEGTHRRDRHGNLAIAPPPSSRPPAHPDLDEHGVRRLLKGLSRASRGLGRSLLAEFAGWSTADLAVLRLLLEHMDRAAECRKLIAAEGLMVSLIARPGQRATARPHPLIRAERQAGALAAALLKSLNLGGAR